MFEYTRKGVQSAASAEEAAHVVDIVIGEEEYAFDNGRMCTKYGGRVLSEDTTETIV